MRPATMASKLALSGVFVLGLSASVGGVQLPDPPASRWQLTVESGGTRGQPAGIAIERSRVIVAGTLGGDARGDGTDAAVHAYRRANGAPAWSRRFSSERSDKVAGMVTASRAAYVIGTAITTDGAYRTSSFVRSLATRTGATRWESLSSHDDAAPQEALYAATLASGRLFVVGSADRRILVRAYKASSGRLLWEDSASQSDESERAQRVVATEDRVYVVGDRDTLLGRSAPYVARAYDAATGERLWESQFGQQVNNARGLVLAGGRLVVGGYYWDIGPGVRHMEVRGLDAGSGEVLWSRLPAGRAFSGSYASALLGLGDTVVVGGRVSRARTLPVLRSYAADGTRRWEGEDGPLRSGELADLTTLDGVVVATGRGRSSPSDHDDLLLQGYDAETGRLAWDELVPVGAGNSGGLALGVDRRSLAIAGVGEAVGGNAVWIVQLWGLPGL